jgi:SagB-type dehydrogenase family enzyme
MGWLSANKVNSHPLSLTEPKPPMPDLESLNQVLRYHERSKHHLDRYARSLGYLDWATQPDPFRRYVDAPRLRLDHPSLSEEPYFDDLFELGGPKSRPLNRATISQLFYDGLALSAWKQTEGTAPWSLRVNPSSGDLHPTEGYLIAGPIEGLSQEPGIDHYSPYEHALERRRVLSAAEWKLIAQQLPEKCVLLGLTSVYWRESWKYGERAFRYCHHDVGHAIGALTVAARVLGWQTRLVGGIGDDALALLLGVHRQRGPEAERPDCLLAIIPSPFLPDPPVKLRLATEWLEQLAAAPWLGEENRLSSAHHAWPLIDEVAAASHYDGETLGSESCPASPTQPAQVLRTILSDRRRSARRIIRERRSAVAMDGHTELSRDVFYRLLARVTPQLSPLAFRVLPWRPRLSLVLFVHRVRDLAAGLYLLVRHSSHRESLQEAIRRGFLWERPPGCPDGLELYLLHSGDTRETAQIICCHQNIAAAGVFSLGMLAHFGPTLLQQGPVFYPRLFWEAGLIGQLLYLEAEAAGLRATGIGCFFDDAMHHILGIEDLSWQSLYHFTVGGPLEDRRLKTLEPYFHLAGPAIGS